LAEYAAARVAAPVVAAFFRRHLEEAAARGEGELAAPPDAGAIEAIIDAAFWASLRREEGSSPRISLAYLPPDSTEAPLTFGRAVPLEAARLTKLAPAVEQPGIHLGVWPGVEGLLVWGATPLIPNACFVLEVVQPGLLVVKHRRAQATAKFANVAVLDGDRVSMVDEAGASLPDCPALVESLLGFDSPASWGESSNVLVRLAVAMRRHGRGGSLLYVPAGSERWRDSVVQPPTYPVAPPFSALARFIGALQGGSADPADIEGLHRAIDTIAGLTAVDGATAINDRYEVLAFGAKIRRRRGADPVERVTVTEPVVGNSPEVVAPSEIGGTRHLSAAQFVQDQHDALALVASQDGRFTVFAWSPCEEMVHGHRVEALLL